MIKNQRQYQITKSQLEQFHRAIADAEQSPVGQEKDAAAFRTLEIAALRSQVDTFEREIKEYEELLSGRRHIIEINSFEELPRVLIQARIASGMGQKELAARLGLKEQQIQRYEASDYESASLSRIKEIVAALGLKVRRDVLLPSAEVSLRTIWKRLEPIGLSRNFVVQRLLPRSLAALADDAEQQLGAEVGNIALSIAGILGRIFGFMPSALFTDEPMTFNSLAVPTARFKLPSRIKEKAVGAYTVYAHYLALLVLAGTQTQRKYSLPDDWEDVRKTLIRVDNDVSFKSALLYVWNLGIPVLPLRDSGTFHGACWRVDGRNVIVLKQRTQSQARWLIDLLHELFHALDCLEDKEFAVIEESELSDNRRDSSDEREATEFAGDVVLDGRAEELAELCAHLAGGSIPLLTRVVPQVAKQENVSVGALANYIAFHLSAQGKDWWGAAQNLQEAGGEDPWQIARDVMMERLIFDRLNPTDRELLSRALMDQEDEQ
jgi:transcriptional regulator with XRE-family HTH domain